MLRIKILPRKISIIQHCPLYKRYLRKTICNVISVAEKNGSGSYDSDDEEESNISDIDPEHSQTIHSLNKLFYYDYTISYQDLKDLIVGTFKKLYRIQLEVREKRICFVVYPEIKSEDDIEYRREMDAIASILSDYAMKEYLYNELKKIDVFKRGIIIIPLNFDLQQK